MSASAAMAQLAGETALLLWSVRLVGASVRRALGAKLSNWIGLGLQSRFRGFAVGLAATAMLQSSTATAFLVTSLAGSVGASLAAALAAMLGANVGATLVVQMASLDAGFAAPGLLALGVCGAGLARRAAWRDAATAVVGLGLLLLSLRLMGETLKPAGDSQVLRALLVSLGRDTYLLLALSALCAWAAHSSAAVVLFAMSLGGAGVIDASTVIAMVLGANLGTAVNPLSHAGADTVRRRIATGNLFTRVFGCALATPFVPMIADVLSAWSAAPARIGADFHLAFNLVMAAVFIGALSPIARALEALFPDPSAIEEPGAPRYLDRTALDSPGVAIANASREALRMSDIVDRMLRGSRDALILGDGEAIIATSRMDDEIDRLFVAVQLYLSKIDHAALSGEEGGRIADLIALTINLEHVGDIIDNNLMQIARDRVSDHAVLSPQQKALVERMHERLLESLRLAMAVFMQGDIVAARRLVEQKDHFRAIEREATEDYMAHLRGGLPAEVRTGALFLDITRDLKRIEAYLAATAQRLLECQGQLRDTRLAPSP